MDIITNLTKLDRSLFGLYEDIITILRKMDRGLFEIYVDIITILTNLDKIKVSLKLCRYIMAILTNLGTVLP